MCARERGDLCILWLPLCTCAGVFHTRHEDGQSGRVWEGIIKYHIGAILDQPDVSPDRRLSVCNH